MKLFQPVKRVAYEEIAHWPILRAREVNCSAPRGMVPVGEEIRRDSGQVVSLGSKMVVDHVQKNGETASVACFDEVFERLGSAILRGGRVKRHAVVTPIAMPRKLRD